MRTLIALLLAAAPALLAYEVRSEQHVMTIDVEGEGDQRAYVVRISDASGALLVTERLTPRSGSPAQMRAEVGERVIRFHVTEAGLMLSAMMRVEEKGMVVDLINAGWQIRPAKVPVLPPPPPPRTMSPNDGPPYRVGGDVQAPVVISRVEPLYPEEARQARVAGIVIVEAIIDREGKVSDARVLKPLPFGLDQAALDAIRQWKFRPGTLHGQPVDVIFNLTINFRPSDEEAR